MLNRKETLVKVSAILLMVATPKLATVVVADPVLAQSSPSVPLPSSSLSGTTTKVDGSSSMTVINEALKKRFEEKFPGTKVELAANGTDEALKALLKGDINLAAVGRPLTSQDRGQGLVATPISREKIAIIVGSGNPFKKNLTFEQFAKIFRGEITNWSQVGGSSGAIRFIDRPNASDTRRSLSNYKVFKAAKFATGTDATQLPQDDTAAVVRELGKNGISYAVASQVLNQPNVRVLPMHNTSPTDPRYPYSQPRSYVHKANLDPGTLAFLGFVTSSAGQDAIQLAKAAEVETASKPETAPSPSPSAAAAVSPSSTASTSASPSSTASTSASPESAAAATESHAGIPWWLWLLPLVLLGGLLWWLLRRGQHEPAVTNVAPVETDEGTDAHLGAAASTGAGAALAGGAALASDNGISPAPVADAPMVTDTMPETTTPIADVAPVADAPMVTDTMPETTTPIADVAPIADAPIVTDTMPEATTPIAEAPIVTDTMPETTTPAVDAGLPGSMGLLGGAALAGTASQTSATGDSPSQPLPVPALEEGKSRIVLTPHDSKTVYASWEVPQAEKDALKQQGGEKLKLRLYDVTGIDIDRQHPLVVHQFDCNEQEQGQQIPIAIDNRDYVAEVGYITNDSRWLQLARSAPVRIPTYTSTVDAIAAGGTLAGGAAALATEIPQPLRTTDSTSKMPSDHTSVESRITLTPQDNKTAYASWEVSQADKDALKQQGGQRLMLRLYDATDIDIDRQMPHSIQYFDCDERKQEQQIPIAETDRDYIAELGYVTDDERWLPLTRSAPVRSTSAFNQNVKVEDAAVATGAVAQSLVTADPSETPSDRTIDHTLVGSSGRITLTPQDSKTAYASWEVSQADKDALKQQGGQRLMLRLYDATDIDIDRQMPHSIQYFDCDERKQEQQIPITETDRDYIAELGYVTDDERWLPLTRSAPVRSASASNQDAKVGDAALAGGAATATGAVAQSPMTADTLLTPSDHTLVGSSSHIALTSRDDKTAYVYWEAPQADKDALKRQGGQRLMLRLYDTTGIDIARQVPPVVQQFDCDERDQERYIPIRVDDRDYVAELGYVTNDGRWLKLATSNPVRILLSQSARGRAKRLGGLATGGAAFAARASTTAQSPTTDDHPSVQDNSSVNTGSCSIKHLTVHSKDNCCLLNPEQLRRLQEETAVSKVLEPGTYIVRIKSGAFSYGPAAINRGEPFVLLWIYGGKFINKKTNVTVDATWSSLIGYADTLSLDVLETATLCAFFFDTHVDDNEGEVTVSVIQLPLS